MRTGILKCYWNWLPIVLKLLEKRLDQSQDTIIDLFFFATAVTQFKISSLWIVYVIIQKPRNYGVGRGNLVTLHALFGNWCDQIYFSFFSNCEEIKLLKTPPEKEIKFKSWHQISNQVIHMWFYRFHRSKNIRFFFHTIEWWMLTVQMMVHFKNEINCLPVTSISLFFCIILTFFS